MVLLPIPKKMTMTEGTCPAAVPVTEMTDCTLSKEEYKISIQPGSLILTASCDEGFFRANTTLQQIVSQNLNSLPCLEIHDWPDFPNRGLWYSVAGRVPTVETLKRDIDFLAGLKINHLQVRFFDFPSFEHRPVDTSRNLTSDELREVSVYAAQRYMQLVPSIQTFGHMGDWLELPEYADLAECPDGYEVWGRHQPSDTLNPQDPRSQKLVRKILDDVFPVCPENGLINIGCDEVWGLGNGKSRALCEKVGKTRVFIDFVSQTIEYIKAHGFRSMFWADIFLHGEQEVLNTLTQETIALNWGYERYEVSEDSCIRLKKTGIPYWNCPGTNTWNSLLAQSYKAMQNIARCAVLGKRYGASGLLNTDWCDTLLSHFSPSYVGIAYAAAMGWTVAESDWIPLFEDIDHKDELHAIVEPNAAQIVKISPTMAACFEYLNRFVYQDQNNRMAQVAYDAGLYGHISPHSGLYNSTNLVRVLVQSPDCMDVHGYDSQDFYDIRHYLNTIRFRLENEVCMRCGDASTIIDEYLDSIDILQYAVDLALHHLGDLQGHSPEEFTDWMRTRGEQILQKHKHVWLLRNFPANEYSYQFLRHFAK